MEKFKLSVCNTEFYINRKKNRVRCKLDFDIKWNPKYQGLLRLFMVWNRDPFESEVLAEANLDPQDVFDVEKGMKVARAKAESMAYRKTYKLLERFMEDVLNMANDVKDFQDKARSTIEHNNKYIEQF